MEHFKLGDYPKSLNEVKDQAASLNAEERRQLAAFLTALRMKETDEWEQVTTIKEEGREGWVSLDTAKRRLLGGD